MVWKKTGAHMHIHWTAKSNLVELTASGLDKTMDLEGYTVQDVEMICQVYNVHVAL